MEAVRIWVRQPTTIAGISAIVAAICALYLKQLTWEQTVPVLAGSIMSIVLPDNTAAQLEARRMATAAFTATSSHKE